MSGFTTHTGTIAVYNEDHVDTDRIIPARFLNAVGKLGFGESLFKDVRGGDFPLDQPEAQGATVLVTGTNFGCGSSREHAVWAIKQAGFKAVISKFTEDSPGYSDIFRQNSANNGLLLIELPPDQHQKIAEMGTGAQVTIDLPNQTLLAGGHTYRFEISESIKQPLISGQDLIGTSLVFADDIAEFEQGWDSFVPKSETDAPPGASH